MRSVDIKRKSVILKKGLNLEDNGGTIEVSVVNDGKLKNVDIKCFLFYIYVCQYHFP